MKYIFGPVPSRRLGNSLGVDPIPSKTCNFSCIYCQLGRTTNLTNTRKNFFPKEDIIQEMKLSLKIHEKTMDFLTFVGSGEPTLYKDLKDLISAAKRLTNKPVCVITNGALLYDKEVQNSLMEADVIMPSLDAGNEKMFRKINRPHPDIKFDKMVEGLIEFRKKFPGKIWMEIMLMKNINDGIESLKVIKKILNQINPDRTYINVPIRPPAESWVKKPSKESIERCKEILGEIYNISFPEEGRFFSPSSDLKNEILLLIERHPMRHEQILKTFSNFSEKKILTILDKLEKEGKVIKKKYNEVIFWNFIP